MLLWVFDILTFWVGESAQNGCQDLIEKKTHKFYRKESAFLLLMAEIRLTS